MDCAVEGLDKGTCDGQTITGQTDTGAKFELKRVLRRSPTLGAPAPAGAIALFDGTNVDEWEPGACMTPRNWITPEPAGIYLQAHGHPVYFKNVWIVEKK